MLRSSLGVIVAVVLSGCDVPTYPTGPGIASQPITQEEQQAIQATVSQSLNGSVGDQSSDLSEQAAEAADRVICSRRGGLGGPAGFDRDTFGRGARYDPIYSWERADEGGIGATRSDLGRPTPIIPRSPIAGDGSRTRVVPPFSQGNCIVVPTTG